MAVRNESVRLSLQDDFTSGMARAAAATALLNRELKNLSGQSVTTARVSQNINRDTDNLAKSAQKADTSINQLTGRLRLFADLAAILGPALVPIGAVGIPAIAGLANQLGAAALAGGAAIIAFQGVGDTLEAVNKAALEPTAANLLAADEAMRQLSPAAREMVDRLQELRPVMTGLRDVAATGLFPGLLEAFDSLETRVPEVQRILGNVSATLGDVVASGAEGLASNRWDDFFTFLATEVPATLVSLGRTVGDLTHGMAELWMAFTPLNNDFNGWLNDIASGFDAWASGLDETRGFQEFIDYIQTTGPQVADTFAALANAVIQIVQAAAPLGGPVLAGVEALANALAAIADSDFGTPIFTAAAALALLTRATTIYRGIAATSFGTAIAGSLSGMVDGLTHVTSAQERATTSASKLEGQANRTKTAVSGIGAGLAIVGAIEGINLLDSALDSLFDRDLNTSTLGRSLQALSSGQVMGTIAEVWGGDLQGLNDDLDVLDNNIARITDLPDKILPGDLTQTEQARSNIEKLDEALASLVESGDGDQAAAIFEQLVAKAEEGGNSASQLRGMLEQYGIALRNTGDASEDGAAGIESIGAAAAEAEGDVQSLTAAFAELNGFFDKRAAIRNYEAALDDFRKGLRETGRSFDINSEKGRENQARLDDIATSAIQVAENLGRVQRVKFVAGVVAQLRTMAGELRGPARQAVLDVIGELQTLAKQKPKPKVEVDARAALAGIGVVTSQLNTLDGKVATATIRTVNETINRVVGDAAGLLGYGQRRASGGYISGPGGPRDDAIPAYLSNGEYVIQAAAVQQYGRAMFDRLNAMHFASGGHVAPVRTPAPRGYANGGPVTERVVERGGATVVKVYDVDGQLLGSMRGEVSADRDYRSTLSRQGVR